MKNEFKKYKWRIPFIEMRPVTKKDVKDFKLNGELYIDEKHSDTVFIDAEHKAKGNPKVGDMIARETDLEGNEYQWLITKRYFRNNFELAE